MDKLEELVSKIRGEAFLGSSTSPAVMYHELPFEQLGKIRSHRKGTRARWDFISKHISVNGKSVLDLGCSVGAFCILASLGGASKVVGIDYDSESIEVAKYAAKELGANVEFICRSIDSKFIEGLENFDLSIWLSQWMYVVKQLGMEEAKRLLYVVSKKCTTMVFESAANEGRGAIAGTTQSGIEEIFRSNTCYSKVKNIGCAPNGWAKRNILLGSNGESKWRGYTALVERLDFNSVRKTFDKRFNWMVVREKEALIRLRDYRNFPKLLSTGENFVEMTYCGSFQKILDKAQCLRILEALKNVRITHRDIIPKNLLTREGVISLIDFGWCLFDDEKDSPVPSPEQLGGPYYNRVWNDENAMRICLKESGVLL